MNKQLDEAISRLRQLPEERQQAAAVMILDFLEYGEDEILTAEQWAEVERRLDEEENEIAVGEHAKAFSDPFKA